MNALPIEVELIVRMLVAAAVGACVGLEREIHGHPAGLRTHLLVAVGSAVFTILSFHGFQGLGDAAVDPTRIAAQVVSGIGFLGAGAILKEGFTIRGLTTAASLWGTAALGMAAAVGLYTITVAGTAIILISLWPLRPVADRLEGARGATATVHLEVARLDLVGAIRAGLDGTGLEITGIRTRRAGDGRHAVTVQIRHSAAHNLYGSVAALGNIDGVVVAGIDQGD